MAITYNAATVTARLQSVAGVLDAGLGPGSLVLMAGATPVATVTLQKPSAIANGNILTFSGMPLTATGTATGNVTTGRLQDSNGNIVVSNLSAGIAGSSADIIISNGLSSTLITTGQVVQVLAVQITGGNS
jgi:hypothetical protein